jgi:hypothetical protein
MNDGNLASPASSLFTLAGWLSIFQAVILLPKSGLGLYLEIMSLSSSFLVQLITALHVIGMLVGIFVLFTFQRYLNECFDFHKVDFLINILILSYASAAIIGTMGLIMLSQESVIIATLIVYGFSSLVSILYAVRLLELKSNLSGLLKPYAYTTIASGICGATIVLGHVGNLIYMVSLIFLGIILIRARSELEYL